MINCKTNIFIKFKMIISNLTASKKEKWKTASTLFAIFLILFLQIQPLCAMQDQIRSKVNSIMGNFHRNMEAYYQRTRVMKAPSRALPLKGCEHINILRDKIQGLSDDTLICAGMQFAVGRSPSLEQALADNLCKLEYEGQDLRLQVTRRMFQNVPFEEARKAVWMETATRDIHHCHPQLDQNVAILAQDMFAHNRDKATSLKASILQGHKLMANSQDKLDAVAFEILNHNATIETAWQKICLEPKKQELKDKYPNIGAAIIDAIAEELLVKKARVSRALANYLKKHQLGGTFCTAEQIAAAMTFGINKLSYQDALFQEEKEAAHAQLTQNGGWACLEQGELDKMVNLCIELKDLEQGELIHILSLTKFDDKQTANFITATKYGATPFENAKNTYIKDTLIPVLIQRHYPNINDMNIVEWMASRIVKTNKVDQFLSDKKLDENIIRGALQQFFSPGEQRIVQQVALAIAQKLLSNKDLTIEQAYKAVRIDEQARIFKRDHAYLPDADCHALATVSIGCTDKIEDAIAIIFNLKGYNADDIEKIKKAILKDKETFEQAEEKVGFRQVMHLWPLLNETEARAIAELKISRGLTSHTGALEQYIGEKFGIEPQVAETACDFFAGKEVGSLAEAAEMATFVCQREAALKQKPFFTSRDNQIFPDYELKNIVCSAYKNAEDPQDRNGDAIAREIAQFLYHHPHFNPTLKPIVGNSYKMDYLLFLAKKLLNDNVDISEAVAQMEVLEEEFQERVLGILAFHCQPDTSWELTAHQQENQFWNPVFGAGSLPSLAALILYKSNLDFSKINEFDSLKNALHNALSIFLQLKDRKGAYQPIQLIHYLGSLNELWAEDLSSLVDEQEISHAYYEKIADKMINERKNYQTSCQELTAHINSKIAELRRKFPYLQDTHLVEIAEVGFYLAKERHQQAIFRYLLENKDHLSGRMAIFKRDLADDDWKAYFLDFAEVLANKEKGFSASLEEYITYLTVKVKAMQQKIKGKINLPLDQLGQCCWDIVWAVQMLKESPEAILAKVLNEHSIRLNIPAVMFEQDYISAQQSQIISMQVRGKLPEERARLVRERKQAIICRKLAAALKLTTDDVTPVLAFNDVLNAELKTLFKAEMKRTGLKLPQPMIEQVAGELASAVLTPNIRKLPLEGQQKALTTVKYGALTKVLEQKQTLQAMDAFKALQGNEKAIAEIMVDGKLSFGEAFCKNTGLHPEEMKDFRTLECLGNLILLDIKKEDFDLPDFRLSPENLLAVAQTLSQQEITLLDCDGKDIGRLYRQAKNLTPTFVEQKQKKKETQLLKIKENLQEKWNTFYRSANRGQMGIREYWEKHPYHPAFLDEVIRLTDQFNQEQADQGIRVNIDNLRHDPWYVESPYDKMPAVTTENYEGFRNIILGKTRNHLGQTKILSQDEITNLLRRIGRFFAWGNTADMYGQSYLQWDHIGDRPLVGEELALWRKRVQLVCEKIILINDPVDEEVFSRSAYLYDPVIAECFVGSQNALGGLEKLLPPAGEITLFNKIFHCLNGWKIVKLNELVVKQINAAAVEAEYYSFAKLLCKHTLSVHTNDETMHNHGTLSINRGKTSLHLETLINEFLQSYQDNIASIIMKNVNYGPKPDNDQSYDIYLQEIMEWAQEHPAYCNILPSHLLEELTIAEDDYGTPKLKEDVICHLLKDAKYIDQEKDK